MRPSVVARVLSLVLSASIWAALPAQQLLLDINTMAAAGGWSSPTEFTPVGNLAFFAANDGRYGEELHVTDGTLLGTRMVRDIYPGAPNCSPRDLQAIGGRVVFTAYRPTSGWQVFASDGTFDGTRTLRSDLDSSERPVAAAGTVFFLASQPATGRELWRTDGTELGTTLVRDIEPGPGQPQFVGPMIAHAGALVFVLTNQTTGDLELWRSDGTTAGTVRRAILPSSTWTSPTGLISDGSRVWLSAVGSGGDSLWRSDLTAVGTQLITTLASASGISEFATVGTRLFFRATDAASGSELWTSDGTAAGTRMVADISPGAQSSDPRNLVGLGVAVYFAAYHPASGYELWRSDGTAAGTTLVRDTGQLGVSLGVGSILSHAGRLVFGASGQLWSSDGTTAGTLPITAFLDELNDIGGIRPFGASYLFGATTNAVGQEPWITDLTGAGTRLLADVGSPPGQSSSPTEFAAIGTDALFLAHDGTAGHLMRSDGTLAGTSSLVTNPAFHELRTFGNRVLILGAFGTGLYGSDGTTAGTLEIAPSAGFFSPNGLVVAGSLAWFIASTSTEGTELWVTDGTASGTRLTRDIQPGPSPASIYYLTAVGNRVFFAADDGVAGSELWVSDGTSAGTRMVLDMTPGGGNSLISEMTAVGTRLFFSNYTAAHGFELWVSDGTAAGTQVLDIEPGSASSSPINLCAFQGQVYFAANGRGVYWSLWRSDGTLNGTVIVRGDSTGYLLPASLTASGNQLFFDGGTPTEGRELWVTNGSTAGTRLVKDIASGYANASIGNLRSLGSGLVVFTASESVFGAEAWRSDGTEAGTFILADLAPGAIDSTPDQFTLVGQQVFFTADDQFLGREPYVMPRNAAGGASVEAIGVGCSRTGTTSPTLDTTSLPTIGNAAMRVLLDHAEPSSAATLLFAIDVASIPLGGGCTLLIAPPIFAAVNFGITTPLGTSSLPLGVPNSPALVGGRITTQAVVLQPGGPYLGVLSFSAALRLRIGR